MEKEINELKRKNPTWSSYVCFIEAIRGKNLPENEVVNLFYQYVDRKDFSKTGISEVLQHCMEQNKIA